MLIFAITFIVHRSRALYCSDLVRKINQRRIKIVDGKNFCLRLRLRLDWYVSYVLSSHG